MKRNELTGKSFGKLLVLKPSEKKDKKLWWICQCQCGKIKEITGNHLSRGAVKSCGCDHVLTGSRSPHWKGCGELTGSLWFKVLYGAKERNMEVSITIEDAWNLFLKQNRKCALTGLELTMPITREDERRYSYSASLDRIDSSKGYINGNIQWIHKDVNMMKQDYTEERFLEICRLIVKHKKL